MATDSDEQFDWTKARIAKLAGAFLAVPLSMCGVSGRWRWWQPHFVLLAQVCIMSPASAYIRRHNHGLYRERERFTRNPGTSAFDKVLAPSVIWLTLALYLAAGFQHRLQPELASQSSSINGGVGGFASFASRPAVQAAAVLIDLSSIALFCWAMCANHFFSLVVRVQADRGHKVCSTGPYTYVRHPGYIGATLQGFSEAVLLMSTWSLAVSALRALLLVVRTIAEERFLMPQLPGYAAYAARVRARWVPLVW